MIHRIFVHIGPPLLLLGVVGVLFVLQEDAPKTEVHSSLSVSVHEERARVTPDGKNLLGLPEDSVQSRITAKLLEEPLVPKIVALTFDDGPDRRRTMELLEILKFYDIHATFFMHGMRVKSAPKVAAAVAEAGHQLGNHGYDNKRSQFRSGESLRESVERTADAIDEATGRRPTAYRPPGGRLIEAMKNVIDVPIILWSIDPRDWEIRDAAVIEQRATAKVLPGDIIILHDIYDTTVQSVSHIIETLTQRGFTFVTVEELLDGGEPGEVYYFGELGR